MSRYQQRMVVVISGLPADVQLPVPRVRSRYIATVASLFKECKFATVSLPNVVIWRFHSA